MEISINYNSNTIREIKIISAEYIGDYRIRLLFDDDKISTVDFQQFLVKAHHPDIKKYLDEKLFASFEIEDGNLIWNDYEMIFPLSDLYTGKIT